MWAVCYVQCHFISPLLGEISGAGGQCYGVVLDCNMQHFYSIYKGMLGRLMLRRLSVDTNDLNQGFKECGHDVQNTANLA